MARSKRVSASAPTKLILFGEHFVVYGAAGIAIPTNVRNWVTVERVAGKPGLEILWGSRKAFATPEGTYTGDANIGAFGAAYWFALERKRDTTRFRAEIIGGGACKGMGNSSSIGAAIGLALAEHFDLVFGKDDLFDCTQRVDEIAHCGRPSGIDARTVVEGKPQLFIRCFSPPAFWFREIRLHLQRGHEFLVVDTFIGKRSTTAELLKRFGKSVGAPRGPDNTTKKQRNRINKPYVGIYENAMRLFDERANNAQKLGRLMDENHALLKERGMSTKVIENARDLCLRMGALGAKLSGAGGHGGALLVLVNKRNSDDIIGCLEQRGLRAFRAGIADGGARIE